MQLYTERLLLRDITIDNRQAIFDYRSDAEANKFQSGNLPALLIFLAIGVFFEFG